MKAVTRRIVSEVKELMTLHEALVPNLGDEIRFWSQQFSEHAQIMSEGLTHTDLKKRAYGLHQEWDEFVRALGGKDETVALKEAYQYCDMTRALKTECLERQLRGEWIGWLGPAFIKHLLEEVDYFVFAVSDELSEQMAVSRWLEFIAEHASTMAHMIDDSQRKLVNEATQQSDEIWKLKFKSEDGLDEKLVDASSEAGKKFDQWLRSNGVGTRKVRSNIPPSLVAHILREGERFQQVLMHLELAET